MKRLILSLIVVVCAATLWAQPEPPQRQRHFDPVKFQQMVEEQLTKAADLTSEEAKAFFPLYKEMRGKQRELQKQMRELKRATPADEKDCVEKVTQVKTLQVEMATVEKDYYKRFCTVIPASKVLLVMKAEDEFHRRMIQGARNKRPKDHPKK